MSLDEIVADTDDGLYLANNRSWSIDDRRLNFQFATEVAYEIKGGKKGRLFKNRDVHRHHLRVLALVRRGRRRPELRDARHAELRQGRAVADGAGRARRARARASATSRWGSASGEPTREPRRARRARRRRRSPRVRRSRSPRRSSAARCAIGATEAEVLVMAGDSALTRFANSEIHQNVAERSLTVSLRHVVGRRIAVVSTGKVDAEGLRSLVHRAAAIARSCEELEDWAGLPAPADGGRRRSAARRSAGRDAHRRGDARSSAPRACAPSSPPRTRRASWPTARSRPTRRPSPSPTPRASAPPSSGPRRSC